MSSPLENWKKYLSSTVAQMWGKPDFTIICGPYRFEIVRWAVFNRSQYFLGMFMPSSADFKENQTKEVDITVAQSELEDEVGLYDPQPECLRALLMTIYSGNFEFDASEMAEFTEHVLGTEQLGMYIRLSNLADRFMVDRVDNVIAKNIFKELNESNSDIPGHLRFRDRGTKKHILIADGNLVNAVETVFKHAGRYNSTEAREMIAEFLNKYLWNADMIGSDRNEVHQMMETLPGLKDQMAANWKLGDTVCRLMCPGCLRVIQGEDTEGRLVHCSNCGERSDTSDWVSKFRETENNETFVLFQCDMEARMRRIEDDARKAEEESFW